MARSNAVLDTLDLGDNLQKALASVRGLRGGEARALGVSLLALAAGMLPLVWYFDVQPTADWIGAASPGLIGALPGELALLAPVIGIVLYLLPTLFEVALPRLAAAGFRFAEILAYGASVFDATTDWPRVAQVMDMARPRFVTFGIVATPVWYVARFLLLAFATIGFELVFAICLICGLALLSNSFRKAVP
jgi:hypothetical protein